MRDGLITDQTTIGKTHPTLFVLLRNCHLILLFRASPATVKWLLDNFEQADGVSLPRARMYDHYIFHSQQHTQEPVNAASFGKLVRSVFTGLKTRRLGTRGNSKYHYYGIRIKVWIIPSKEGCVFPTVIWSEFRSDQYSDDDHRDDASHFIIGNNNFKTF